MGYKNVRLSSTICINNLYTIHYFEYMNTFSFIGERHDFWEFCYADKGEVGITAENNYMILKKGEIVFHQPNEYHNVTATGLSAPNLVVISFECKSPAMNFFRGKVLHIDEVERSLLANIAVEAQNCFLERLDDPYQTEMLKNPERPFGSEQLIKLYLEQFLLHLARRYQFGTAMDGQIPKVTKSRNEKEIFQHVVDYLDKNLSAHLTIEQICRDTLTGRSQLQRIFRERSGLGIMEYFFRLKVEAAKEMIRMSQLNFTQISERLGYSSIHYFSRQFKKTTGMTPSEYASSIKALSNGSFK